MSDSDIGKTFPFAQQTRTSVIPAASIASNTAGSSFDDGVGRNWLSITTATLALAAEELGERRPVDRLRQRPARGLGRVVDGRRLVGLHDGDQVRRRDVDLERVAVLLRLVVRRSDREGIHRLVRDDDTGGLAHRVLQEVDLWLCDRGYIGRSARSASVGRWTRSPCST